MNGFFGLDIQHSCLLLNVALFGLLLWYYQKYKTTSKFNQTTLILLLWLISAICGLFYLDSEKYYIGDGQIKYSSVFIVFALFLLYVWPILVKQDANKKIVFKWNALLYLSSLLVAISAYLPFVENCYHLFVTNAFSKMGTFHDEMLNKDSYAHLSILGTFFSRILLNFSFITPALFANYMHKDNNKRNKFISIGLVLALMNHSLSSFSVGARYVVVQDFALYLFLYLIVRHSISHEVNKTLVKYFGAFFTVLALGVALITIVRFGTGGSSEGVSDSLFRYIGEGFNNCYTDMMYVKNHTYGLHMFRNMFGMTPEMLSMITGIRMFVFYTFIGDFICDFDILPSAFIFLLISTVFYFGVFKKVKLTFVGILFTTIYASVFATGFMYVPFMNVFNALYYFGGFVILYFIFNIKV